MSSGCLKNPFFPEANTLYWDDRTFAYFVKEFGPITRASALDAFAQALDQENEERAIREAAEKGEW